MGGSVQFRILGALEVRRDGQAVPISAAKLRIILACLLIRSGQVVPVATLIDRLWEDHPPAGARAALQTYVARLRRILDADGYLQTRGAGYVLNLPPGSCDIDDFNELADQAGVALSQGDRGAALDALRKANELYRGPILSDVESVPLHRDEVSWLSERCLEVAQRRFELELALGHPRRIVEELRTLTAAYPLRESLRAFLMRALNRSGRQTEALDVYRETRDLFRTQLGLDPGPELRSLHQAILRGEEAEPVAAAEPLDRAESGEAPDAVPYPILCQLPPAIGDFVGRAEQMAQLEESLTDHGDPAVVPVVVVSGVAGVGKTTLAVRVAHRLRDRFPDGQLYINLDGGGPAPRDVAELLGDLLTALGAAPSGLPRGLDARAAAFRARVADRRVLIVLDDAADADNVAPLLPGTPGAAVLITSRRTLGELPTTHRLRLRPFSVDEGVALLSEIVDHERVSDELPVAREIVDLCGGLPLAVRIVGARLQPQRTALLSALAGRLRDDRRRLDELAVGRLEVRSQLELAYSGLAVTTQVALRRVGLLAPGSFAPWALGALTDHGDGQRLVEQLTAAGLLEPVGADATGQPRYRPHDLVALFARELAARDPEAERRAAVGRLLDVMVYLGHAAYPRVVRVNECLPPEPLPDDLRHGAADAAALTKDPDAWVHSERSALLHAIEQACRFGWYGKAALLADLVIPALAVRGGFEQLQRARALTRDAALAGGDELLAYRAETNRADILLSQRIDEAAAAFERCVPVFRRLGLSRELVHSLTGLSFARVWQGLPGTDEAAEAMRIAYAAGEQESIVLAVRSYADALVLSDRHAEALPYLREALASARELQNADGQRAILVRVTDCAISLGDLDMARRTYAEALKLTDPATNTLGFGWLLVHHSRMRSACGDVEGAIVEARQAYALMTRAGDARGVVAASLRLAEGHIEEGDPAKAASLARDTLSTLDLANVPLLKVRAERLLARVGKLTVS